MIRACVPEVIVKSSESSLRRYWTINHHLYLLTVVTLLKKGKVLIFKGGYEVKKVSLFRLKFEHMT